MATREDTKKMVGIMQKFLAGQEIEYKLKRHTTWRLTGAQPLWDWDTTEYRVMKRPREWFLVNPEGEWIVCDTQAEAIARLQECRESTYSREIVLVVESNHG